MPTSYQDQLGRLYDLSDVGNALIKYALTLIPSNKIQGGYNMWVPYPANHFAFRVQLRVKNIRFSVRGLPGEFEARAELPLKRGWGRAYSEFVVERPDQLLAASSYLARSAELYRLGRHRLGRAA